LQGADPGVNEALRNGDLEAATVAGLDPKERALLELTAIQTKNAYKIHAGTIQNVRDAGWRDEEIMEGLFIGAYFNLMVRMADSFGLPDPSMISTGETLAVIDEPSTTGS
jgi:alkylhydroperoxidase family enzyme